MNNSDLNTSWRPSQTEYESKNILQKAYYTAARWAKTAGRAIVYPFKKAGNSLWGGFYGCCAGFKNGFTQGWAEIKFTPSQYGLPQEEKVMNNNNNSLLDH